MQKRVKPQKCVNKYGGIAHLAMYTIDVYLNIIYNTLLSLCLAEILVLRKV